MNYDDYCECPYCGAFFISNQEHECPIPENEEEEYLDYCNDIEQFAQYCQVESRYRGKGMW